MLNLSSKKLKKILFFILFFSILYFALLLWFRVINVGTLSIVSDQMPFKVLIESDTYECSVSPCEIELSAKTYDINILKEAYADTKIQDFKLKRLKEVSLKPYLLRLPELEKIEKEVKDDFSQDFELKIDSKSDTQLLLLNGEETSVRFPSEIVNYKIFPSNKHVFIQDLDKNKGYTVNLISNKIHSISLKDELLDIEKVAIDSDAKTTLLKTKSSTNLRLFLNESEAQDIFLIDDDIDFTFLENQIYILNFNSSLSLATYDPSVQELKYIVTYPYVFSDLEITYSQGSAIFFQANSSEKTEFYKLDLNPY